MSADAVVTELMSQIQLLMLRQTQYLHSILKLLDEAVDTLASRTRRFGMHHGKTLPHKRHIFASRTAPDRQLTVLLTVCVIGSNTVPQT